jgi:hypothetical protein
MISVLSEEEKTALDAIAFGGFNGQLEMSVKLLNSVRNDMKQGGALGGN